MRKIWNRLKANDKAAITFAALAVLVSILSLLISAIGFYWNNFRIDNELQAIILNRDSILMNRDDSINLTVAVFNTGNRPAIIQEIYLCYYKKYLNDTVETMASLGPVQPHDVPNIIHPDQIKILEVKAYGLTPQNAYEFVAPLEILTRAKICRLR